VIAQAIANFYCLRVMQFIQHVFPIAGGDKKLGLIHGVPCFDLATNVQDSLAMSSQ
jgi:hypothetical protein